MLGAIIGDIVGSRFEFGKVRNKSEDFEFFHEKCKFTDDTIMTVATADAILNNKNFDETYREWGKKYLQVSYGSNFRSWIMNENMKPYGSYGNGSAMRVSPVGWLSNTLDDVFNFAEKSIEVTHNHEEGIKGGCSVACCIYLARNGVSKKIIKELIEYLFEYNLSEKLDDIRPNYKFDVSCQGSVPQSIICFLEGNNYEDVVRKAISLGGDTDTMGAIAGSIAEAYYGIPENIKNSAMKYLDSDIISVVNKFYYELSRKLYNKP